MSAVGDEIAVAVVEIIRAGQRPGRWLAQAFEHLRALQADFEPLVGVRIDESDAPRERIAPLAFDVRGDGCVEHESLWLAET